MALVEEERTDVLGRLEEAEGALVRALTPADDADALSVVRSLLVRRPSLASV